MALNLEVSTTLWHAIEPHRKRLTAENYKLATGIAGLLARIIDQQDELVLSVEYEHLLETMALEDVPGLFKQFGEIPANRADLISEGNSILNHQLTIILNKVNEIKEEYSRSLVTALKAKNTLVEGKYALTPKDKKTGLEAVKAVTPEPYNPDVTNMLGEINPNAQKATAQKRKWFQR